MHLKILPMMAFAILLIGCCDDENAPGDMHHLRTAIMIEDGVYATGHGNHGSMNDLFPKEHHVHYGTNKHNIAPDMQEFVAHQVDWMKRNPGLSIIIEGHCDERGTREYNLALGERRANGVKDYMVAHGIDSARIATISYGKDRPIVLGSTPEVWVENRVSISVVQ